MKHLLDVSQSSTSYLRPSIDSRDLPSRGTTPENGDWSDLVGGYCGWRAIRGRTRRPRPNRSHVTTAERRPAPRAGARARNSTAGTDARPALSRRRELGDTSARSLLMTILGEFVLPRHEAAWTSTLVAALAMFGVEEKSAQKELAPRAGERPI